MEDTTKFGTFTLYGFIINFHTLTLQNETDDTMRLSQLSVEFSILVGLAVSLD